LKSKNLFYSIILAILILHLSHAGDIIHAREKTRTVKTIGIIPFDIHSSQDLEYIKKGISRMLNSRLAWDKKVDVILIDSIHNQAADFQLSERAELISKAAEDTMSDFILTGSVTKFAGSFSIDTRVYDIENNRYMSFFEHSRKIDDIIKKTDRIAAAINKKIFGRTTITWKNMETGQKDDKINQLRRNPEYLMKNQHLEKKEGTSPGWKIWKKLF